MGGMEKINYTRKLTYHTLNTVITVKADINTFKGVPLLYFLIQKCTQQVLGYKHLDSKYRGYHQNLQVLCRPYCFSDSTQQRMAIFKVIHITIVLTTICFAMVLTQTQTKKSSCPQGRGGPLCRIQCPTRCITCTDPSICQQCQGNYEAPGCTDCKDGFYGVNCQAVCSGCKSCHPKTGACPSCSEAGLALPGCDSVCPNGTYGMHCGKTCPRVCSTSCDSKTGDCLRCDHGHGKRCSLNCSNPNNFAACSMYCKSRCRGECEAATRRCDLCAEGLSGEFCDKPCQPGRHGRNCRERCPVGCGRSGCEPVSGVCRECKVGLTGSRCTVSHVCPAGRYGENCSTPCPQTCAGNVCHDYTGKCLTCPVGHEGDMCDVPCSRGTYGQDCRHSCPEHCSNGACSVTSGQCMECKAGYKGNFCNITCGNQTWGEACAGVCSHLCAGGECNHVTGYCSKCPDGYEGHFCNKTCSNGTWGAECSKVCNESCAVCHHVTGDCIQCLGNRTGSLCTGGVIATHGEDGDDQEEEDDGIVSMQAVYIFLGLIAPVVVVSCPMAIYKLCGKRFIKRTKGKKYREKTLQDILENTSPGQMNELPYPDPRKTEEGVEVVSNQSEIIVDNSDLSFKSQTRSSVSKTSKASKFSSNVHITTCWNKPKTLQPEDVVSRDTRSNSLALDISLTESEDAQNSSTNVECCIGDEKRHGQNVHDASKSKSFKGSVHFQHINDQGSTSASQSLSISGSCKDYIRSFSKQEHAISTKASTGMKKIKSSFISALTERGKHATEISNTPLDTIDDGTQGNIQKQIPSFEHILSHENSSLSLSNYQRKHSVENIQSFTATQSEKRVSLTEVNLWKARDGSSQRFGGYTSTASSSNETHKELTTFQRDDNRIMDLTTKKDIPAIQIESASKSNLSLVEMPLEHEDALRDRHTEIIPDEVHVQKDPKKSKTKPSIKRMFDNVLDAMQSNSDLYQNRKNVLDPGYDTSTEEPSSSEGPRPKYKHDVRPSVRLTDRRRKHKKPQDGNAQPGSITLEMFTDNPLYRRTSTESPPKQISRTASSAVDTGLATRSPTRKKKMIKVNSATYESKNSRRSRKPNKKEAGINLRVGLSPTQSGYGVDSISRPTPSPRRSVKSQHIPPSRSLGYKIKKSQDCLNIAGVSNTSESDFSISEEHPVPFRGNQFQMFQTNNPAAPPVQTDGPQIHAVTIESSSGRDGRLPSHGLLVTGVSPLKSQPTLLIQSPDNNSLFLMSTSVSSSFPGPTFSLPGDPSVVMGVVARNETSAPPGYQTSQSASAPGNFQTIERTDKQLSDDQPNIMGQSDIIPSTSGASNNVTTRSVYNSLPTTNITATTSHVPITVASSLSTAPTTTRSNANVIRCKTTRALSPMRDTRQITPENLPSPQYVPVLQPYLKYDNMLKMSHEPMPDPRPERDPVNRHGSYLPITQNHDVKATVVSSGPIGRMEETDEYSSIPKGVWNPVVPGTVIDIEALNRVGNRIGGVSERLDRVDSLLHDGSRVDSSRPGGSRVESPRPDWSRVESPRPDGSRVDSPRPGGSDNTQSDTESNTTLVLNSIQYKDKTSQ